MLILILSLRFWHQLLLMPEGICDVIVLLTAKLDVGKVMCTELG